MFRATFIYLSKAGWARHIVTRWKFAWNAASRFVAGETLEDAMRTVSELNQLGINATLDHLGEHTTNPDQANTATQDILAIFDAIEETGVRANVSIKLTQIGLAIDERLAMRNLRRILSYARQKNNWVRIDMEDSPWVDITLRLYQRMRADGLTNVGVVVQSYLYRSEDDIRALMQHGGRVRLCKGAYKEPADVAFPKKKDVDANYDRLTEILIAGSLDNQSPLLSEDCRVPPILAVASHDPLRIEFAKNRARQMGMSKLALEFQMLYGIGRDMQKQLVREGYPVRVYVPYGAEWYPYFVRRLAERPANLWFFLSNFFRG